MRVAIVSYGFPPIKHVNGTRASQMAAWLVELGHEVCVVTVDWRPEAGGGDERANGVLVRRVDPRRWFPAFDPAHVVTEPPRGARWRRLRVARQIFRWGPFEGWGRAAFAALSALHERAPIDVVWAIHGDDGAHESARRFHDATGVPWVADFKDPWHLFHPLHALPLQLAATALRLRSAAYLTETCHRQAEADALFRKPTAAIWSGYDEALMNAATPVRSAPEFSLVYVGHVAQGSHDVARYARIVGMFDADGPERTWALHVFGRNFDELTQSFPPGLVERRLRLRPYVALEEAYGIMKGADVLMLLPASNGWRGGGSVGVKELEYMASGAPILCLGTLMDEMGAVANQCDAVFTAGASDASAVAFLRRRYDAFQAHDEPVRHVSSPPVRAFAWGEQAKLLSGVLEECVAQRHSQRIPLAR